MSSHPATATPARLVQCPVDSNRGNVRDTSATFIVRTVPKLAPELLATVLGADLSSMRVRPGEPLTSLRRCVVWVLGTMSLAVLSSCSQPSPTAATEDSATVRVVETPGPTSQPVLVGSDLIPRDIPCFGPSIDACRYVSPELKAAYADPRACDGNQRRVCLLPIGNVPLWQIEQLVAYFKRTYQLELSVLPAWDASDRLGGSMNSTSEWKLNYSRLEGELRVRLGEVVQTNGKIVALTPVDMHSSAENADSFVFGVKSRDYYTGEPLWGMISTFRMNPQTFGDRSNDDLWFERIRKLFTKYVGVTYYGLDEDQIPSSAMYQPLYSLRALDGIHGDLSVTASTPLPAPKSVSLLPIRAQAPCHGSQFLDCLKVLPQVSAQADNECRAEGRTLCLMVLGAVPWDQVLDVWDYLTSQGVRVDLGPAFDIPESFVSSGLERIPALPVTSHLLKTRPELLSQSELSFLFLTPVDIGNLSGTQPSYVEVFKDGTSNAHRYAVVPTFRINPSTFGQEDDEVWRTRIRKLSLRSAGFVFFGMPFSVDMESLLKSSLYSPEAVDRLRNSLPP